MRSMAVFMSIPPSLRFGRSAGRLVYRLAIGICIGTRLRYWNDR
jgi:hypothetical protein